MPVRRSMHHKAQNSRRDQMMSANSKLFRSDVAQASEPSQLLICVLHDRLQNHCSLRHRCLLAIAASNLNAHDGLLARLCTAPPKSARPCETELARITNDLHTGSTLEKRYASTWSRSTWSSVCCPWCLQGSMPSTIQANPRSIQRVVYPTRSEQNCVFHTRPIQ